MPGRRTDLREPSPNRGAGFRPDIEGLRAIAVVAVVLFHAQVPGVAGGYVGVDVFFVISGFLITGLLVRDVETSGRVRFARFYAARARRLLPAAMLVLVATAVSGVFLLPPLQVRTALGDALASALYAGNYRFAAQGTDYLAAAAPPSPFQHYWSLGVEEQFYLLWPALVAATAWPARRRARALAAGLLAVVAAGSFAVSLHWTTALPAWAFFSLPTRAWQLAAGGLVALAAPAWHRLPRLPAGVLGWIGLSVIAFGCVALGGATKYPGTAALVPVVGTVLVVAAGCAPAARLGVARVLSVRLLRAVGRLSYAWYLWHWPVLLLAPAVAGAPLDLRARLVAVAVSAGLAVGTLVVVENPVRFAAPLRRSAVRSLGLGAGVTALGVTASLIMLALVPPPVGSGPAVAAPRIGPTEASAPTGRARPAAVADPAQEAIHRVSAQVAAAVAAAADLGPVPSNLSPPLAAAAADKPRAFLDGCLRSWLYVGQPDCAAGDVRSPTRIALVGDSHAAMWSPPMEDLAARRHWRLETMGKVTCPLVDLPIRSPYLGREYSECQQWREQIVARLAAEHPALVVLSAAHRYTPDYGFTPYSPAWLHGLAQTVRRLRATGASVLVLGPVPDPHSVVPTCLSAHLDAASACSPPRRTAVDDGGVRAEARAVGEAGGHYAVITDLFCTAQRCPVVVGNRLVYRDDNHVTVEYATWLEPVLAAEVDAVLK